MITTQQQFPNIVAPLVDPQTGVLNQAWYQFFVTLWVRTGGSGGDNTNVIVNELALLQNANNFSLLEDLLVRLGNVENSLKNGTRDEIELSSNQLTVHEDVLPNNPIVENTRVGSWTPVISGATTAPTGATYSLQSGTYIKFQNLVFITGRCRITNLGAGGAGDVVLQTLPFTPRSATPAILVCSDSLVTYPVGATSLAGVVSNNSTNVTFQASGTGFIAANLDWTGLAAGSLLRVSGFYVTN